jgi:hypothetical protein
VINQWNSVRAIGKRSGDRFGNTTAEKVLVAQGEFEALDHALFSLGGRNAWTAFLPRHYDWEPDF